MASIEGLNFNGLASGLDTQKIIENLMEVESRPLTRLENSKTDLTKKSETFNTLRTNLVELQTKASQLKSISTLGEASASSSDEEALTLKVAANATTGNYSLKIISLAQAKSLSSDLYTITDTSLGFSGEILINGQSLKIRSYNTLTDIRNGINALDAGVTASILKVSGQNYRLIISAEEQGIAGFTISNVGATDILGQFGFTDGTKNVREIDNGAVVSIAFDSAVSTIGSLAKLSSGASGTVSIRNQSLSIDLSKDSLSTIRDKINNLNLNGVRATVESVEVDGDTLFRLSVTGTEVFTDNNNILETLGVLEGGTSGTLAQFETAALTPGKGSGSEGGTTVEESTKLSALGSVMDSTPETITISGTQIDGTSVTETFEINKNTQINDLLDSIEEAFSGNVTAELKNGKITVVSTVAGANPFTIDITAHNENGGTLDFGSVTKVVTGRDRLLVEGTDAKISINNIEVMRSTNEINDVLTGLTLNLKKADPDTIININVEQNLDAVTEKINDFVKTYNNVMSFINENSKYDNEENVGGPLFGDMTTRTIVSRIRSLAEAAVGGKNYTFNQLAQVGIESTVDGLLKVDTNKLKEAITDDIDAFMQLFTVSRSTTDDDITFVYSTNKTKQGTYDVKVTLAAEKAEVKSDSIEDTVDNNGTITIADNFGSGISVDFTGTTTLNDIANLINEEAQKSYAEIQQSNVVLLSSDVIQNRPIDQNSTIGEIRGANVEKGDTITIRGTTHRGANFSSVLTLDSGDSTTVQDILDAIEKQNANDVSASIDSEGHLIIQDNTTGASQMSLTIETTVDGLDFGEFLTTQKGRNIVSVSAEVTEDNRLNIMHTSYGSKQTFTVSGATDLGITNGTYAGIDVAGSINGVEGIGSGRTLTASTTDANTRGIVVNVSLSPEDLDAEGKNQGTITLVSGIADRLYNEITSMVSTLEGFLQVKVDSLTLETKSIQSQIDNVNQRLVQKRTTYVRQFALLEKQLSALQVLQQRLTASLATLPQVSL